MAITAQSVFQSIFDVSKGDFRRALTILQGLHQLHDSVTSECVFEIGGQIPQMHIDSLFKACLDTSSGIDQIRAVVELHIARQAYSGCQLLEQVSALLAKHDFLGQLNSLARSKIALKIAAAESTMLEGADETLQLIDVFAFVKTQLINSISS